MASGLLGTKIGMTQVFKESGECIPVTVVRVGPCTVVQKKSKGTDGYDAIQLGYETIHERHVKKPMAGHFKANGLKPLRYLREFRVSNPDLYNVGMSLDVALFEKGDIVDVSARSKGKGFQGVIKRHGHSGGPGAHGSRFHRAPGSIGQNTFPGEVAKGTKLPGRMGGVAKTVRKLEIVGIKGEESNILLRGAVPGPNGAVVVVRLPNDIFEKRIKDAKAASDEVKESPQTEVSPTEEQS